MFDIPGGQVYPEGLKDVFPPRVVVGFIGKVTDLSHKGKNISEAAPVAGCFLEDDLDPATCRELRPTQ